MKKTLLSMIIATAGFTGLAANAATVEVNMTVKETDLAYCTTAAPSSGCGLLALLPGPLVRVKGGDVGQLYA
ncbi:MAG: hypothetical protein U5K56_00785 [Halioglobus sp.]|nr:hypothetical protein [Halioglobus sp.]